MWSSSLTYNRVSIAIVDCNTETKLPSYFSMFWCFVKWHLTRHCLHSISIIMNDLFIISFRYWVLPEHWRLCLWYLETTSLETTLLILGGYFVLKVHFNWNNRVFRIFHKSTRSDISDNVVDICLCVNIMLS